MSGETVAASEAGEFVESDADLSDRVEWPTARQHLLLVPSPWSLPLALRVDFEGIEHHAEGAEPAERRFVLR